MKDYDVIVCPGVGTFPNGSFNGRLLDYYSYVLYKLSQIIPKDNIEIHMDITHGLNYMPALTYKAIKELLGILAITNKAKFYVYNSDPYSKGGKKELYIHTVENREILPSSSTDAIDDKKLIDDSNLEGKERGEIRKKLNTNKTIKELKNKKQNINAFLSSFVYALPLIYSTFYVEDWEIKDIIDEILSIYLSNIDVGLENKTIKRKIGLDVGFDALVKAYFTAKVCKVDEFIKDELSLGEITKMGKILFRNNNRFLKSEIDNSICRILINNDTGGQWILLREFRKDLSDEFNIRNFLAHAGFEKNLVEIKAHERGTNKNCPKDKSYLRYSPNYIKEKNGVKKLIYKRESNNEEINVLEKLEEAFINEFNK
ncbi:CRISPR-associated protein, MJ1666 family [Methanotorris formicicus Mc-S-70]|uniref:CRISPR-associated protein, MJ1666 family n=1 Tax=Methanotorris formicicus Mc-S-70 TaxID=647171 RepID=H1L114_9EURY|nr:CRISPR-associated CARF protein Csx1 [Methanotorris formicicus]EHP84225.1 CRISPR-associated protein, MJ1666 family [Methanotorris formicicus Mc-S-70]